MLQHCHGLRIAGPPISHRGLQAFNLGGLCCEVLVAYFGLGIKILTALGLDGLSPGSGGGDVIFGASGDFEICLVQEVACKV